MTAIFVGIDPGLTGAVAIIEGEELEFHDTPVLSTGTRNVIDAAKCAALLRDIHWDCRMKDGLLLPREQHKRLMVTIEKSQPMPPMGKKDGQTVGHGSIASFSLGYSFGIWIGILAALEIPYQTVAPQTWKALLMKNEPKEKDASRLVARRLWPTQTEEALSRKKDHNRADALLLAEYGRRISGRLDE